MPATLHPGSADVSDCSGRHAGLRSSTRRHTLGSLMSNDDNRGLGPIKNAAADPDAG
jgi:hypothetical protein